MPSNLVKAAAKKHNISVDKAEKTWKKAKAAAADQGHKEDYAYINGVFQKMLGESIIPMELIMARHEMQSDAWYLGYDAGQHKDNKDNNPYNHGSLSYKQWEQGFEVGTPDPELDEAIVVESSEQLFKVTYDVYGNNKEKPLYTKTQTVRANSEQEAINVLRKLVGGTNYRIELDEGVNKVNLKELVKDQNDYAEEIWGQPVMDLYNGTDEDTIAHINELLADLDAGKTLYYSEDDLQWFKYGDYYGVVSNGEYSEITLEQIAVDLLGIYNDVGTVEAGDGSSDKDLTETHVAELGVDVNPDKWYVVSGSNSMHGGVNNAFDSEADAFNWATAQPNIDLADDDAVISGKDLIEIYALNEDTEMATELDNVVFSDFGDADSGEVPMEEAVSVDGFEAWRSEILQQYPEAIFYGNEKDGFVAKVDGNIVSALNEAFINGRDYASQNMIHPSHAKNYKVGELVDFYATGTGDKIQGTVVSNDGKKIVIKATKNNGGKTHAFKVGTLTEAKNNGWYIIDAETREYVDGPFDSKEDAEMELNNATVDNVDAFTVTQYTEATKTSLPDSFNNVDELINFIQSNFENSKVDVEYQGGGAWHIDITGAGEIQHALYSGINGAVDWLDAEFEPIENKLVEAVEDEFKLEPDVDLHDEFDKYIALVQDPVVRRDFYVGLGAAVNRIDREGKTGSNRAMKKLIDRMKKYVGEALEDGNMNVEMEPPTPVGDFIVDKVLDMDKGVVLVQFVEGTSEQGDYAVVAIGSDMITSGLPLPSLANAISFHGSFNDALKSYQNKLAEIDKMAGETITPELLPIELEINELPLEENKFALIDLAKKHFGDIKMQPTVANSRKYISIKPSQEPTASALTNFEAELKELGKSVTYDRNTKEIQVESYQLSPFERAGLKVTYSEDGKKAFIKIFTEQEMVKFNKTLENFANPDAIGEVKYKVSDSDENALYEIEIEMLQYANPSPSPEQAMKEMPVSK